MSEARTRCTAVAVVFAIAVLASIFAVGSVVASDDGTQSGMSDATASTPGTTVPSVLERHTGPLLGQVNETDTPDDGEQTEEDQQTATEQAQTEAETESEETETPTESEQTEESTEGKETETPTESEETEEPTEDEETEEPTQTEDPTEREETETPTQTDEPTDDGETEEPTETEEPAEDDGTESGTQEETEADDDDGSTDTDDSDNNSEDDTDANRDESEESDDSDNDGGSDDSDDSDDSDNSQSDDGIYDDITEPDDNETGTTSDGANLTAQNGTRGGGAPAGNTTDDENGTAGFVTETATDETATPAGQGSAGLQIRDASLSADWVRSGFNTTVRTTVQNSRSRPVNETLTVTVDGEPVATNEVALDPEEETVVETEFEAVNGTVRVNGETAGRLTVENQSVPATVGDEQATTAAQGPGLSLSQMGVGVAILAVIGWTRWGLRR